MTTLPITSLLNCFISGLRDDIQRELYILRPQSLYNAIDMARLVEDKYNVVKPPPHFFLPRPPLLALPPPATSPPPRPTSLASPLQIKRLTPAEMASRRERGLCYNCDAKYTKGHRCTSPQFLCLMTQDDDFDNIERLPPDQSAIDVKPDPPDLHLLSDNTPCISYHALNGFLVPSTLKIAGKLFGKDVMVLIDSGSRNNFIQTRWANHLHLTVQPSFHLRVTVGNGEFLTCGGECLQVPLQLGDTIFSIDLILLPVFGVDIVLGVNWL